MAYLPGIGTLQYNGFTFPSAMQMKVTGSPVYDESNRVVKYTEYTIEVDCIIYPGVDASSILTGSNLDTGMDALRSLLTRPGKALYVQNKGMGTSLTVNQSGSTVRDIKFGPKPKMIRFEPIAGQKAYRIVWSCTTCVYDFNELGTFNPFGILSYWFDMKWKISRGLTVRTVKGGLEIASGQNFNFDSYDTCADLFREQIKIPKPLGFTREQDFAMSSDKRTLHFTIADSEIGSPNAYHPGIINPNIEYTVRSGLGSGAFAKWDCSLGGTIEVSPGYHPATALIAYALLLKERREEAKKNQATIVTREVEFKENVFDYTSSFNVRWDLITTPGKVIEHSGLWKPTATSWEQWDNSLVIPNSVRGIGGMRAVPSDDRAVTKLNPAIPAINNNVNKVKFGPSIPLFNDECPQPPKSWIAWESHVTFQKDTRAAFLYPVGPSEAGASQDISPQKNPDESGTYLANLKVPQSSQMQAYFRGASRYYIILWGSATRVCYGFSPPSLVKVGNAVPREVSRKFILTDVLDYALPARNGKWRIIYEMSDAPVGDFDIQMDWTGGQRLPKEQKIGSK